MNTILELLKADPQAKVVCGTRALYWEPTFNAWEVWSYSRGKSGVKLMQTEDESEAIAVLSIG